MAQRKTTSIDRLYSEGRSFPHGRVRDEGSQHAIHHEPSMESGNTDTGQPTVVHEVMMKRIIAAAQKGERTATRLRDAALTGLRKPRNQIRYR
jgi:hypothetical protein